MDEMRTLRGRTHLAVASCLLILAAGCSNGDREAQLERAGGGTLPTTTTTTAPTTTTIPTVTRDTPLTLDGLGPIRIGARVSEINEASDIKVVEFSQSSNDIRCVYGEVEGGPIGISVLTNNHRIARVDITSNSAVRTLSGLSIGDTSEDVRRLYPTASRRPHEYIRGGSYYTFEPVSEPANRALVVEVDADGKVLRFRAGDKPEVNYSEGCS